MQRADRQSRKSRISRYESDVPYNEDRRPYVLHRARRGFSGLAFSCNSVFRIKIERNNLIFGQGGQERKSKPRLTNGAN